MIKFSPYVSKMAFGLALLCGANNHANGENCGVQIDDWFNMPTCGISSKDATCLVFKVSAEYDIVHNKGMKIDDLERVLALTTMLEKYEKLLALKPSMKCMMRANHVPDKDGLEKMYDDVEYTIDKSARMKHSIGFMEARYISKESFFDVQKRANRYSFDFNLKELFERNKLGDKNPEEQKDWLDELKHKNLRNLELAQELFAEITKKLNTKSFSEKGMSFASKASSTVSKGARTIAKAPKVATTVAMAGIGTALDGGSFSENYKESYDSNG